MILQSKEELKFYNQVWRQHWTKMRQRSYQTSELLAQRYDLDSIYESLLMDFFLIYKGSRRLENEYSRITLLSDPPIKVISMKVDVFSDSTLSLGVSNPDPFNN